MNIFFKYAFACLLFASGGLAFGQIPETQHSQGIAYISGGVGQGETDAILAEAKQWPVLLELSQLENGRGVWIFGAQINIMNQQQKLILNAQANGPYMLINLTPGNYQITASYQGVKQSRALTVKADSSQKINIFWK
jgi:hypothetical protein